MAKKRAWVHQLKKQVEKVGEEKAAWYVSWRDPAGTLKTKSCGAGKIGLNAAKLLADKRHAELITETYQDKSKTAWEDFMVEYKAHVQERYDAMSSSAALTSIATFERVAKPKNVRALDTQKIDEFIRKRKREEIVSKTAKTTRPVSPATINRELRYVRAALRLAVDWGYLVKCPKFRFLKAPEKLPTFVNAEHFAAIFEACDAATMPADVPNVSPADWWRGLLILLYMSGWRIRQTLSLRWEDIDLEQQKAITKAEFNKGKRDQEIPLHPIVVQYLKPLAASFRPEVFPWESNIRNLWPEFQRIQEAAKTADGKPLPKCGKDGRWYGFHDMRRGFATMNAATLDLFELQALMQHKSLATTRGYVNMALRLTKPVSTLFVPELRKPETA